MNRTPFLLICAAGCMLALSARADFEQGLEAYDTGDITGAIENFRPLAEAGHAIAAYNLGIIHSRGATGAIDMEAAVGSKVDQLGTVLTTGNVHHYLSDLSTDIDVVSVERVRGNFDRRQYLS